MEWIFLGISGLSFLLAVYAVFFKADDGLMFRVNGLEHDLKTLERRVHTIFRPDDVP